MLKRTIIGLALVAVMAVLGGGAWQVAYAQGQAAGRAAVLTARTDFLQNRPGGMPGGVVPGQPGRAGAAPAANATPGTGPGNQSGGQGGRAGQAPLAGTIDKIDGAALILTTDSGSVTVKLDDQTRVHRQVAASASDLKAGDRVVVSGARAADGGLTAAAIQIQGQ
jgi:hypothetical protein